MPSREAYDTMGAVQVPEEAYFGAQTQRAVDNFPISGLRLPTTFNRALALIKQSAARVNGDLGLLSPERSAAVMAAAGEVLAGKFDDQFVVDVFQTGSGTSSNMNMNEVIAARANEILTGARRGKDPVHPNDHVNLGQSSNDVIPSALHVAALTALDRDLLPALAGLQAALAQKAAAFENIKKIGRTHLQDAVPMTLGQEFSGYARQVELGGQRLRGVETRLAELPLGGTAVGTGVNTHAQFGARVTGLIAAHTGLPFTTAGNRFEAQAARDAAVETSGALKTVAVSLTKIANDIRWLASGPRCGLGEINLPALQPGSSIMPGKVNPVIPEAVIQAAAQVIGNDATITLAGQGGYFELNAMVPVIAYNLLQSLALLASVSAVLETKCVRGITANPEACAAAVEKSLALVTGLVPHIGYERAAALAQKAFDTGQTIREIASQENILPEEILKRVL